MFRKKEKQFERRRPLNMRSEKPPAMQYYRGPAQPPKEQGRRQTRQNQQRAAGQAVKHLKRMPVYLSILAIIVSLVYCSILGNKVTVVLAGSPLYPKAYYESLAGDALNDSIFNHSKLTLDVRSFKERIKKQMPEVSDVSVSIPFVGRKPVIGLSLVPAKFLLTFPDKGAYVVGSNGVILADSSQLDKSQLQDLRVLQEDVPQKVSAGQKILTTSDIAFIETVLTELHSNSLEVAQLELPIGASELFVHLKDVPYMIKFALNGDSRQQVGAFLAVRKQLGAQVPVSYIDVRVGERVYVK